MKKKTKTWGHRIFIYLLAKIMVVFYVSSSNPRKMMKKKRDRQESSKRTRNQVFDDGNNTTDDDEEEKKRKQSSVKKERKISSTSGHHQYQYKENSYGLHDPFSEWTPKEIKYQDSDLPIVHNYPKSPLPPGRKISSNSTSGDHLAINIS
jgi:hypothetical protein